ncbi:MAG TPA: dihydrolipoyllysine-residue acetyltransferase [Pseudomonadales bacterium]
MSITSLIVPDFGDDDGSGAEIIEICVAPGARVKKEDSLLVLESEKATFEMPAPADGEIKSISVKVGDTVTEGAVIGEMLLELEPKQESDQLHLEDSGGAEEKSPPSEAKQSAPSFANADQHSAVSSLDLAVPDFGDDDGSGAEIIEICVAPGAHVKKEDSVLVLESEKATFEMPAPADGEIKSITVKVGDTVNKGTVIGTMLIASSSSEQDQKTVSEKPTKGAVTQEISKPEGQASPKAPRVKTTISDSGEKLAGQASVYAGPAVRRLARDLGVDLRKVTPTGPRQRVIKDDLYDYVKKALSSGTSGEQHALPEIDFSKYGETESTRLNKLRRVSAKNLTRSWVTVPHVTQFDEADITDLESFRKTLNEQKSAEGIKLTMPVFLVKLCVDLLRKYPDFNASLHPDGETLIRKHYYHIGMAVDTPNGLLVPVIKNAEQKNIIDIAQDIKQLSAKARENKLMPQEMQGGTFSITSLGGIGGTAFTPIVNWPEVAILGLSKAVYKPVYNGKEFEPRLMLPISLSYDHRVIDGVAAAKFTTELVAMLANADSYSV